MKGVHIIRLAGVLLLCVALGVGLERFVVRQPDAGLILSWSVFLLLLLLAVLGVLIARKAEQNVWLAPISLMMVYYFVRYGVGCLVINYWESAPVITSGLDFAFQSAKDNIAQAATLAGIGGVGLFLGILIPARPISSRLPVLRRGVDWSVFKRRAIFVLPLCALLTYETYLNPASIPVSLLFLATLVGTVGILVPCAFIVGSLRERGTIAGKWGYSSLAFLVLNSLIGLPVGMRGNVLRPLAMIFFCYLIAGVRLPRKVIVAGLLIVLVGLPWLTVIKNAGRENVDDRYASAMRALVEMDPGEIAESVSWTFASRLISGPTVVSKFSQHFPGRAPYIGWESAKVSLESHLPRIFFPEKGNVSGLLNEYSREVGIVGDDDEATSAQFDAITEYYVMFGPASLFFFSMLHGFLYRVLYEWLIERSGWIFGPILYLYLFVLNLDLPSIFTLIPSYLRFFIVTIPLCLLISTRLRQPKPSLALSSP